MVLRTLDVPAGAGPSTRFEALDGLRGFAVLLVFCVHAAGNATRALLGIDAARASDTITWTERVLYWLHHSHHGVFLFFVLSGYLIGRMWWPHARLSYGAFAWRRTLRVYPAFLVTFVASLLFAFLSETWQPPDLPRLLANPLFLNGWPALGVVPFNIVTWSLFYEMTFYLLFPAAALVALRAPKSRAWILPGAGIVVPVAAAAAGADPIVLCWSLLFCGVAAAVHQKRLASIADRLPAGVIVGAYLAVTTLSAVAAVPSMVAIIAFGAVSMMVLVKSLRPGNLISSLFADRLLVALGRISYSFYLVHWMIVVLVARWVVAHPATYGIAFRATFIFVAAFALSVAAAGALWWLAERPYLRWVHDPRAGH